MTEFGRISQLYGIEEDNITEEIINTGVVLMYIRLAGAPAPRSLPMTGYVTSSTMEQHIWYRLSTGLITLVFHNLNNTDNPGTFGSSNQYRYIIIPGGTLISRNITDVNNLTYQDAVSAFGILQE